MAQEESPLARHAKAKNHKTAGYVIIKLTSRPVIQQAKGKLSCPHKRKG